MSRRKQYARLNIANVEYQLARRRAQGEYIGSLIEFARSIGIPVSADNIERQAAELDRIMEAAR